MTAYNNSVPKPQAIDDEYLVEYGEGQQPEGIPSRLTFFSRYIVFCEISKDILERLHSFDRGSLERLSMPVLTQYLSEVPTMCLRLDEFLNSLPAHLQNQGQGTKNELFLMQGQILKIRSA